MKNCNKLLTAIMLMFASIQVEGQATISSVSEDLDINHFKAKHTVHGDMWYDHYSSEPSCEYPKGTGRYVNSVSGLWVGGFDGSGILKGAAALYRSIGVDYWPGPIDPVSGGITAKSSADWAKIWKINQSDINTFLSLSSKTTSTVPSVILEWPAKGNPYAKGNAGASLSVSSNMAPFVDVDADGNYDATKGDYPKIKGDQMLWWVINDMGNTKTSTKSTPIGLEIHTCAYAYNRGSGVDRMLFYEYTVYNRSSALMDSVIYSMFSDPDLGYPFDDAIALDSARRMVITFNATGKPTDPLPLTAMTYVEMPGDTYPSAMQKVGSFGFFENSPSGSLRKPKNVNEYYYYMTGSDADGIPLKMGTGAARIYYDANASWNPCDSALAMGDKRFLINSKAYQLAPNSSAKVAMVFMATDTNGHVCPDLKLKDIKDLADTAWEIYWNPLPLSISKSMATKQTFKLYPNPAESSLYLETTAKASKEESIRIIDALGKTMNLPVLRTTNQFEINISSLAAGVYSVIYFDGVQSSSQHFVKQ